MEVKLDVDIQQKKKEYFACREGKLSLAVFFLLLFLGYSYYFFLSNLGRESINPLRMLFFTPWGWFLFLIIGLTLYSLYRFGENKFSFLCPHRDCDFIIWLNDSWRCPFCMPEYDNWTKGFYIFNTIFDKCRKCKEPPPSYKCPYCKFVFELIPGGKLNKFAYNPHLMDASGNLKAKTLSVPVNQPKVEAISPRDKGFFKSSGGRGIR